MQSNKTCQYITDHPEANTPLAQKQKNRNYQKYKKVFKRLPKEMKSKKTCQYITDHPEANTPLAQKQKNKIGLSKI